LITVKGFFIYLFVSSGREFKDVLSAALVHPFSGTVLAIYVWQKPGILGFSYEGRDTLILLLSLPQEIILNDLFPRSKKSKLPGFLYTVYLRQTFIPDDVTAGGSAVCGGILPY